MIDFEEINPINVIKLIDSMDESNSEFGIDIISILENNFPYKINISYTKDTDLHKTPVKSNEAVEFLGKRTFRYDRNNEKIVIDIETNGLFNAKELIAMTISDPKLQLLNDIDFREEDGKDIIVSTFITRRLPCILDDGTSMFFDFDIYRGPLNSYRVIEYYEHVSIDDIFQISTSCTSGVKTEISVKLVVSLIVPITKQSCKLVSNLMKGFLKRKDRIEDTDISEISSKISVIYLLNGFLSIEMFLIIINLISNQ